MGDDCDFVGKIFDQNYFSRYMLNNTTIVDHLCDSF
jgi:hypothetical protein